MAFSFFLSEIGILVPTPLTKKVGDYCVSIGMMPVSDLEKSFPRAYDFLVKHHGKLGEKDTHHLVVSLWKEENGEIKYLSNFKVEAEVRSPSLQGC